MKTNIFLFILLIIPLVFATDIYTDFVFFDMPGVYKVPIFINDAENVYSFAFDVKTSKGVKLINYTDGGFLSSDKTYVYIGDDINLTKYYDGYTEDVFISRSGSEEGVNGSGELVYLVFLVEKPGSFSIINPKLYDSNGNEIQHIFYQAGLTITKPNNFGEKTKFIFSFQPKNEFTFFVDETPYKLEKNYIEIYLEEGYHNYYLNFNGFYTSKRQIKIDLFQKTEECKSLWECSNWSPDECGKDQVQTMICKDINGCAEDEVLTKKCEIFVLDNNFFCFSDFCFKKNFFVLLLLLISILLIGIFIKLFIKKRKPDFNE